MPHFSAFFLGFGIEVIDDVFGKDEEVNVIVWPGGLKVGAFDVDGKKFVAVSDGFKHDSAARVEGGEGAPLCVIAVGVCVVLYAADVVAAYNEACFVFL